MVEELSNGELTLNQPAGHLEDNESLIDAAIRETAEETAWAVDITALVGIYRWRHPRGDTYMRFCFSGTPRQQLDQPLDADIHQAVWLSAEAIAQRQAKHRSPLVAQCIADYLSGQRYSLDLLHN